METISEYNKHIEIDREFDGHETEYEPEMKKCFEFCRDGIKKIVEKFINFWLKNLFYDSKNSCFFTINISRVITNTFKIIIPKK